MSLLFDPRDPAIMADPYPTYQRLQEIDPIHRSPLGFWVLTKYDDVNTLLRSSAGSSEFHRDPYWVGMRGGAESPIVRSTKHWMVMLDGPAHRRIRRLVSRAFAAPVLEGLKERVGAVVGTTLDRIVSGDSGRIDLIGELALPLPVMVICELLGIPPVDLDQHPSWTDRIGRLVDPGITAATQAEVNRAEVEFSAFITEQLAIRRADPRDDVLSLLLTAEPDGERLTDEEIVANVLLLFDTGHETAVNLIGNGVLALLRNPSQLQLLRDDPGLIGGAVEEIARYDPPVQLSARITTEDVRLGSTTIPAGAFVLLLLGAANRDPERYPDPHRFDITRTGTKTLAFGAGPHYCVGAMLGKMETGLVITELLRRFRRIEPAAGELTWRPHFSLRGLTSLPLRVAA